MTMDKNYKENLEMEEDVQVPKRVYITHPWQGATSKAFKAPTKTKWIDRVKKDDDGREFVRCRLVTRDFKPRREGPRDDLFGAMPPLEAHRALFAYVAGVREKAREQGQEEGKLVSINAKKTHSSAQSVEEEWVALLDEFKKFGKYAKLKRWFFGMRSRMCEWYHV